MKLPDSQSAALCEELRGLHLGRCARRILLLAPDPTAEPQVLLPERTGRAASESHRRAMRRLATIGLVELSWKTEEVQTTRKKQANHLCWDGAVGVYQEGKRRRIPVRRAVEKRAVKLTPLGALVVDRARSALESGQRIRWAAIIDSESQ